MERSELNILVLHRLGHPSFAPYFLRKHVYAWRDYAPEHNFLYHDTALPLPDYVRNTEFDAIILDVTLLCMRWASSRAFERVKHDYGFIADSAAVKIALPQDEYDCNVLLDQWMCDWKVDVVVSVISENWDILYPGYHKQGKIILGYTGYIDGSLLNFPIKNFSNRSIDIGYRAKRLPPYFGRVGMTKWQIGERVKGLALDKGMDVDIVLGDTGTLYGNAWLDFINDSRFTLGANSGSSMLDPYGKIQKCVHAYLARNPGSTFKEVEQNCFPGIDGKYAFTAISPRVLEAGILESGQILVEGAYSGVINKWEHYIPIAEDASDFDDVVAAMRDETLVASMIRKCKEAILDNKALRAEYRINELLFLIREAGGKKKTRSDSFKVRNLISRYNAEMKSSYRRYYISESMRKRVINSIKKFPTIFNYAVFLRRMF